MITKLIDNGCKEYIIDSYIAGGELFHDYHNPHGPAVTRENGYIEYWLNGLPHNIVGMSTTHYIIRGVCI